MNRYLAILLLFSGCGPGPPPVPPLPVDGRVVSLGPTEADQRFLAIRWHADLLVAQAKAKRLDKPLFMWLMDGNPLAAT